MILKSDGKDIRNDNSLSLFTQRDPLKSDVKYVTKLCLDIIYLK